MATPYTILIRNNDGIIGAAVYDTPTSDARPILAADWPEIGNEVNAATLEQLAAQELELTELRAYKAKIIETASELKTKVADPAFDSEQAAIDAYDKVLLPEKELKRKALEQQQAEIAAQLAELAK